MIVADTSALMAVLLDEPDAEACIAVLESQQQLLMSATTVAEALIVAQRRNCRPEMERVLQDLGFEIVPVTVATARRVAQAYERWGKGLHRASLNFGDCFAYDLAKDRDCPLLFVGDDFTQTDVRRAMKPSRTRRK